MVQKLIGAKASVIRKMTKRELLISIKESEGRVVLSESTAAESSLLKNVTGAEMSRAFGADMVLLNDFNAKFPKIAGLCDEESDSKKINSPKEIINLLKDYIGIPVGANIDSLVEPVIPYSSLENREVVNPFLEAQEIGLDFIVLTGNPETGVTNKAIEKNISVAKKYFEGIIIAGKMHRSGVDEQIINLKIVEKFINAGADIIMLPAVGSFYGIGNEKIREIVEYTHYKGKLVMSAIGTSQESCHPEVIRNIAIQNKILGVDIQHIGDSNMGLSGYENIKEMSEAIRGKSYTLARIVQSINR